MPKYLVGPSEEAETFLNEARLISATNELEAKNAYVRHIVAKSDGFLEYVYATHDLATIKPIILDDEDDIRYESPAFESRCFEYFDQDEKMSNTYLSYVRKVVDSGPFVTPSRHRENPVFSDEMLIIFYEKSNWSTLVACDLASIHPMRAN